MAAALAARIGPRATAGDVTIALRTIRFVAAARLPSGVRLLSPALADPRALVRDAAADALGELGDKDAIAPLLRAYLDDPHDLVFGNAVYAIARIGGDEARAALVAILGDRNRYQNVRWPAAEALGILRDRAAVPALVAALDDEFAIVRRYAAKALGSIGAREALPSLWARLENDDDASVIIAAAEALGQMPDPASAPGLARRLDNMHPGVREAAALALAKVDPPTLLEVLRRTIADEAVPWRGQALRQLAEAFGWETLPTLLLLSRDRNPEVRVGAADGLRLVPGDASAERLVEMLADEDGEVREAAVSALDQHQHRGAVAPLIVRAEDDPSVTIRMAAIKALAKLNDRRAVAPLIRLLKVGGVVGAYAANTLGILGDERAIPELVAAWRRNSGDWQRDWYSFAIGRIGGAHSAVELRTLLPLADEDARLDLITALRETQDAAAVSALLQVLDDRAPRIQAAARAALASLPRARLEDGLLAAVRDGDPVVRRHAAIVSPFYAEGEMQRRLESLQDDPDKSVAAAAKDAAALCRRKRA
jgi:HEAT repeat protein